jgi:exodeoxyribonuclease-1
VRATIALARRLRTAQPRLFEHCLKLRDKQAVALEIGPFDGRPFLHVSGMFGAQRGCLAVVAALGPHPQNRNEIVVWDLAYDPAELFDLSPNAARARLFTASGSLPDGVKRLPIKTIHLNRSPVVVGNLRALSRERAEVLGIEIDQACRHATVLQARRPDAAWLRALYARDGTAEPHDVDEALYDGFISDADRRRLDTLRAGTPAELAAHTPSFDDPRLEELLFRYRARNWPETLNPSEQARWAVHRAARLEVGTPGWLNATAWWASLEKLRADHTGDAAASATLDALAAWGRTHVPHP